MVKSDVVSAFRLCQKLHPTAELIVYHTKNGSYQFGLRIKGRTRFKEKNAQDACERLCDLAGVQPLQSKVMFRPTMPTFIALYFERLGAYKFEVLR